jgi:hypothetical protein
MTGPAHALLLIFALQDPLPREDGYRGIWYMNQPSKDEHRYKYSGGFATYPQQHVPIAIYSPAADRTFFVYGGTTKGRRNLLHMVSYYDHATGTVPRPAVLLDKRTDDAHDNPVLLIDREGHLWIFSNAHGTSRPSWIHRSVQPGSIDAFERVLETNFSYGQPWHVPDRGILFLHTRYAAGRGLHWMSSPDGRAWSALHGARVGTAFNPHPRPVGLNARADLYYVETPDFGATWRSAGGDVLTTPLEDPAGPALVHDTRAEGLLVYLKDLQFDDDGRPVVLYLTSRGYEAGPKNAPRTFRTARWTGSAWERREAVATDHNYDYGFLVLSPARWRLLATSDPGPQAHGTGGELVLWESPDRGASWKRVRAVTRNSALNHSYPRRPLHAHPDFAALWADGDAHAPSASSLYFTNAEGDRVWRLPARMEGDSARPEPVE